MPHIFITEIGVYTKKKKLAFYKMQPNQPYNYYYNNYKTQFLFLPLARGQRLSLIYYVFMLVNA